MIKISESYAVDFDLRNIILQEKFEKREGKGKHAPLSGEVGYRDVSYHGTFKCLVDSLVEREIKVAGQEVDDLYEIVNRIEQLKDVIINTISNNIQNSKGD